MESSTEATLRALRVPELKAQLRELGLKVGGRKEELVQRLLEHVALERSEEEYLFGTVDDDGVDDVDDEEYTTNDWGDREHAGTDADENYPVLPESRPESANRTFVALICIAAVCAAALYKVLDQLPQKDECDGVSFSWLVNAGLNSTLCKIRSRVPGFPVPSVPGDSLSDVVLRLKDCAGAHDQHQGHVYVAFSSMYIFFQTFAVPGPNLFLSIAAGAMFPSVVVATLLVAACCTTGAVLCYSLSYIFLADGILEYAIPERVAAFRQRVGKNKGSLFYYMLFLRLTPLLPNWFINVASPVVGVPVSTFGLATFLGQMPMNAVYWYSGSKFKNGASRDGNLAEVSWQVSGAIILLALASVIPLLLKSKFKAWEAQMGR